MTGEVTCGKGRPIGDGAKKGRRKCRFITLGKSGGSPTDRCEGKKEGGRVVYVKAQETFIGGGRNMEGHSQS